MANLKEINIEQKNDFISAEFKKHKKALEYYSFIYAKKFKVDRDEIFSKSMELFLYAANNFNQDISNFKTYLNNYMKKSLKRYCIQYLMNNNFCFSDFDPEKFCPEQIPDKNDYYNYLHMRLSLSDFSKKILDDIQNNRIPVIGIKNTITKQSIYKYYRSCNIPIKQINYSFNEIKEVLFEK